MLLKIYHLGRTQAGIGYYVQDEPGILIQAIQSALRKKLLESNPTRMCCSEGEGDGSCGNVVLSNTEGLILALNISGIVWTLGQSPRGGVMYSWFS